MTLALYMDHNVVRAVTEGCRLNGLNVLTAYDDGCHQMSDRSILERASELERIVFTQDSDFLILAADLPLTLGRGDPESTHLVATLTLQRPKFRHVARASQIRTIKDSAAIPPTSAHSA